MFSLYPLGATQHSTHGCDKQKCLQTLSNASWGVTSSIFLLKKEHRIEKLSTHILDRRAVGETRLLPFVEEKKKKKKISVQGKR
jgi:hypothetical protein